MDHNSVAPAFNAERCEEEVTAAFRRVFADTDIRIDPHLIKTYVATRQEEFENQSHLVSKSSEVCIDPKSITLPKTTRTLVDDGDLGQTYTSVKSSSRLQGRRALREGPTEQLKKWVDRAVAEVSSLEASLERHDRIITAVNSLQDAFSSGLHAEFAALGRKVDDSVQKCERMIEAHQSRVDLGWYNTPLTGEVRNPTWRFAAYLNTLDDYIEVLRSLHETSAERVKNHSPVPTTKLNFDQ